ncbi:TPA: hypothetical protein O7138_004449 [Salmonella enterica]|nr:hypothetical protein [Salmonella enterica]
MALRTKVKYGLSAAMLALIAAGASAPQLLDQFLQEREGNTLVAVRDNGCVWSVCRGVTRADFENRRRNSVARNARNILEAIRGEILSTVENVVDVYVTHNPKKTEQKAGVSQYPLTPGSFYVGVYGGSPADIAAAIWRKAPPGIDMNGDTTFTVADKEYDPPYPEYVITWQTLKPVSLHVSVTLKKSDYLPSDITQQVQQSVLSAFNGTDGGLRARVASVVSAGRYYAGVYKTDPENIDILGLTVSRDGSSWTTAVTFGIDEIPVLDVSNIGVKLQEA